MGSLDTDIAIELSPHGWMQVQYAIDQRVAELYRHRTEATAAGASYAIDTIDMALKPLSHASALIGEALYPEDDAPDGIDLAKREIDILEDHGYPLITVGGR